LDMDLLVNQIFVTLDMIVVGATLLGIIQLAGRRRHQLRLRQEERRLVEARTLELAEQNRRFELEHRLAEAELERYDRRTATRELSAQPQDR
jgi:hypothetical protein